MTYVCLFFVLGFLGESHAVSLNVKYMGINI